LIEEVAFLTYHLHWPHDEVMAMEHRYRRDWIREVSAINTRINESAS
jgi:hypothetical protein